jgi:autotransporter-associated beta strand protein
MKTPNIPPYVRLFTALIGMLSMLLAQVSQATEFTNVWNSTNAVSADTNWSDVLNWSRNVAPGSSDDVVFSDQGGAAASSINTTNGGGTNNFNPANVTSVVDANRTVHWLYLGLTNNWQNLYITNGVTLTVQGTDDNGMGRFGDNDNTAAPYSTLYSYDTMYVGRKLGANVTGLQAFPTKVSIAGEGTLFLNNTNNQMQVRDANSFGGSHTAILDMSALATFKANLARLKVGMGEQNSTNLRAAGILYLARTNTLVLSGPIWTNFLVSPSTNLGIGELANLVVGVNPQNAGNSSYMYLGWSNGIFADFLLIGGRKSGGMSFQFNPAFANLNYVNTQPTPTAYFRGSAGGPVSFFNIGDEIVGQAGTASTATNDLRGGIIDISANNMIIGRVQPSTGGQTTTARFGDGVINVANMELSSQGSASAASAVTTTVALQGTKVTVTNTLKMVNPFQRNQARTVTLGLGPDPNGVNASFTTLGSVSSGYVDTSLTKDSTINVSLTNASFNMVTPQPFAVSTLILDNSTLSNSSYVLITGNGNSATVNNGYGKSLSILNSGNIIGTPILDLGVRTADWDVTGIGGAIPGTLVVSNALQGLGTIDGNVEQAPGATIQVGEGTAAGSLTINGNLTLNTNGNLQFGLSASGLSGNDTMPVSGSVTLLGTNSVTLTALGGSFDTNNAYTLITSTSLPANGSNYFKASGALGGSRYILSFDTTTTPNDLLLHVSGTGSTNDIWSGDGSANVWDVKNTPNWTGSQFFDLDNAFFNDLGSATPAVNCVGTLIPGTMNVATTNKNYGFGGTGSVVVSGDFNATGKGSVTFTNSGGATFQGGLNIGSNAVTLGNGTYTITGDPTTQGGLELAGGSLTFSGNSTVSFLNPVTPQSLTVTDGMVNIVNSNANVFNGSSVTLVNPDSLFVFGQPASVSAACDAVFTGAGGIIQNGPGLIAFSGANGGLGSPTLVNGGTLQLQNGGGAGSAGITVANGATLDNFGVGISIPVTAGGSGVGGQGAIFTSSTANSSTLSGGITMTTNLTIGGTGPTSFDPVGDKGRMVISGNLIASATNNGGGTNAFNFIKSGGNAVRYDFSSVDPQLANIDVQGGMLYLQGSGGLGNPTNTITVESGATLAFAAFTDSTLTFATKKWILNGNGSVDTLLDYATTATVIDGPVTLNGDCVMDVAPASRVNNGNSGVGGGVEILGPIGGTGNFDKTGSDTWTLDGTNTYTGSTFVVSGTLKIQNNGAISNSSLLSIQNGSLIDVSGRIADQSLNLGNGQTLNTLNVGYINGNLSAGAGSIVAPGGVSTLDTLSVIGNVTLAGTTSIKLDANLQMGDNLDATNGGNSITYGGTLNLTKLNGTYAIGQSYTLFNASSYAGTFSSIVPAQPGSGLSWNTNNLVTSGTITIQVGPVTGPTTNANITHVSLSGTNVVIHGTNNNTPSSSFHYVVLTTPNITNALSNWTPVVTNPFNGDGSFDYTNPIVPGVPRQFIDVEVVP